MKLPYFSIVLLLLAFNFSSCKTDETIPDVKNIVLNQTELSMIQGDSIALEVSFEPAGAKNNIVWTSSNEKVAVVTSTGKIKAISRGFALIKAQGDSLYASCNVNVTRTDLPYQLVWSEEFDGTTLDLTKWNIETGGGGWGNNEKQYYTNRTDNLRLENGSLVIEAKKEVYQTNNYTSARINSRDKVAYKYGKIEARINLPPGKGTWPAFWMMGANITAVRWPLCGEIDIMEHVGSKPTMISHATHTTEKNGSKGNNWYSQKTVADVENNYHTYAIEWEEKFNEGDDCISFYIDGVKSATVWEPHVNATLQQWPFKADFYLLLNIAIGGNMGGTIDDTIFNNPILMKVDYVRIYQRK
jgi:beta-glucanase (GH16 family)